jgi:hypothetical protein
MSFMKTQVVLRLCVLLLGGVVLVGCDFVTGSDREDVQDRIRERIENRQDQWASQNIVDYEFTYSQQIGEDFVDSVKVYVRGGDVDSISTSMPISREKLLVGTVDSFFDLILARVGEEESQFNADFDQEVGYPTEYTATFADRPDHAVVTLSVSSSEGTDS